MILELVSAVIAVIGTLLITFKNKIGFLFWIVGNILWVIYGFITKQYFFMTQYIIFSTLAIYGFVKWFQDDLIKSNKKVNVRRKK